MGENEQHQPGSGGPPELPPAGVDPETFRQFQEFQRFQQFQRASTATPPAAPPWTTEGGGLVPADTAPRADVHEQLAGVAAQLAKIQSSQEKIEKVTNPPLWRKILRSTPIRWLAGLLILIVIAIWGVPALIEHYIGSGNSTGTDNAGLPQSKGDSGQLPTGAYDAVLDVYRLPAEGFAPSRTCFIFSVPAAKKFAHAFGASSCTAAITAITARITDRDAYATLNLSNLPAPSGPTVTVSSCEFTVTGGPRLGTFTVTKQNQGWEITDYQAQRPCASEPTATTAPGTATEAPIPTGGFSGIPTG